MIVLKKNMQLQTPFETIIGSSVCGEIALRKSILLQAIIDAMNDPKYNKKRLVLKYKAIKWIFSNNSDFKRICMECDLEPSFVRKIVKAMIYSNSTQVDINIKSPTKSTIAYIANFINTSFVSGGMVKEM